MKVTQKGQVTIPRKYRIQYGITEQTEGGVEPAGDGVLIKPAPDQRSASLAKAIRRVRGKADAGKTTEALLRETREG